MYVAHHSIFFHFTLLSQESLKILVYLCGCLRNLKDSSPHLQVGIIASLCLVDSCQHWVWRLGEGPGCDSCVSATSHSSPANPLCGLQKFWTLLVTKVFLCSRSWQPISGMDQKVNVSDFLGHVCSLWNSLLWFYMTVTTLKKQKNHSELLGHTDAGHGLDLVPLP